MRQGVQAADLCNFLLGAFQQMVKQCQGQVVTCEVLYMASRFGKGLYIVTCFK